MEYQYDVAISFAEEDAPVAQCISEALKKQGLKPYFYKDERAEQWGENLFNIVINRYKESALFALILISEHYQQKWWTGIELQIVQTVLKRGENAYLLPLRLDNTSLDGLGNNTLFVTWDNNPQEIASLLKKKVQGAKKAIEEEKTAASSPTKPVYNIKQKAEEIFHIDKVEGGITIHKKKK